LATTTVLPVHGPTEQKSEPNADPTRSSGNCGRRFKRQHHRAAAKSLCV